MHNLTSRSLSSRNWSVNSAAEFPFSFNISKTIATEAGTGMLTLQPKFLSPVLFDFHLHFQTTAVEQRNWHLSTEAEIPLSLRGCLVQIPGGALDATENSCF